MKDASLTQQQVQACVHSYLQIAVGDVDVDLVSGSSPRNLISCSRSGCLALQIWVKDASTHPSVRPSVSSWAFAVAFGDVDVAKDGKLFAQVFVFVLTARLAIPMPVERLLAI